MMDHEIIVRPLVTEKTNIQKDEHNQITFEVVRGTNRVQVKRAVERIFGVRVDKVRTINTKGKVKRRGRFLGRRKDWKKAIVRLMPGERIDFFEGA